MLQSAEIENLARDLRPDPPGTYLRPHLTAENYRALVVDHCQLVAQFENLVVLVMELWEMNRALRERLDLPRQSLPIAGSLACATRTAALLPSGPEIATGSRTGEMSGEEEW